MNQSNNIVGMALGLIAVAIVLADSIEQWRMDDLFFTKIPQKPKRKWRSITLKVSAIILIVLGFAIVFGVSDQSVEWSSWKK